MRLQVSRRHSTIVAGDTDLVFIRYLAAMTEGDCAPATATILRIQTAFGCGIEDALDTRP